MAQPTTTFPTLLDTVWDSTKSSKWLRFALITLGGSLLITASAKMVILTEPVPITMQTFAILSLAFACGWRLAGSMVLFYLLQGAYGFPVFAATPPKVPGIEYMQGPTGGYLIGFYLAAVAVGFLAERGWDRSILKSALGLLIGLALIYIPGVLYLGVHFGWDKPILEWGMYPFLPYEVLKMALAAALFPVIWKFLKKQ